MKKTVKAALLATLPVMAGYLVLGFGFGLVLKAAGYGVLFAFAMSFLIYAGSMQYAAVGLLTGGASLLTAALIACTVVALLHLWKRNTLLSIIGGTVCYMALVQPVF